MMRPEHSEPLNMTVPQAKNVCPQCGLALEVVSDHTGNTLMHVRTTWDHRIERSVMCFTDAPSERPMTDREQDAKIKDLEARIDALEYLLGGDVE